MSTTSDGQRALVREVVGEIEAVRRARQARWRDRPHPEGKRFTQEELVSEVYGAYKNMALGRTLRIPLRADLLRIADWLECSIHETNDLLMAAQYLPEAVGLREDEARAALERAKALLHTLPLPAYVLSRGWVIEDANDLMYKSNNIPKTYQLAGRRETPFDWLGTRSHPAHATYAFEHGMWQRTVQNVLSQFREMHKIYRHDLWYRQHLAQIRALTAVSAASEVLPTEAIDSAHSGATYPWSSHAQAIFCDAAAVVNVSQAIFPQIIAYYPVDQASFTHYKAIGCSVTENSWEHVLSLGGAA